MELKLVQADLVVIIDALVVLCQVKPHAQHYVVSMVERFELMDMFNDRLAR